MERSKIWEGKLRGVQLWEKPAVWCKSPAAGDSSPVIPWGHSLRANAPGKLLESPFGVEGQRAERNESSSVCHQHQVRQKGLLDETLPIFLMLNGAYPLLETPRNVFFWLNL